MIGFLESIIFKRQFGFRHKHSTVRGLIAITEKIKKYMDEGKITCGIFIDLEKAFDSVDHNILFNKLNHYGFRVKVNNCLRSNLTGRKQFSTISGKNSETKDIKYGVPQGSVLGPLLFLMYINDIHNAFAFVFADDTSLLYSDNKPSKSE